MKKKSLRRKSRGTRLALRFVMIVVVAVLLLVSADPGSVRAEFPKIPDDAVARTLDGKTVSLSDLRGKIVFLIAWRTDCGGCIAEIPILNKMQKEFSDEDFTVIGLSMDRDKDALVAKAIEVYSINYPVWLGYDQPLSRYINSGYTPTLLTVGPKGEAIGYLIGPFMSYPHAVAILEQTRAVIAGDKLAE